MLTVALEAIWEQLIKNASDFKVLLSASIQGISSTKLKRGWLFI
jgi:hypothetical protein